MAHPTFWPTKTLFYPIGNTSPVSLLQNAPPENDASLLLLGCGDPRNILYSVYVSGLDDASVRRQLDFTCCDHEPATVARNILLFALLFDDPLQKNAQCTFNIFYHFFLDHQSRERLLDKAQMLANASLDLETWAACEYSRFLHIGNPFTLSQLHHQWDLYARTRNLSAARVARLKNDFVTGMQAVYNERFKDLGDNSFDVTTSRSAGPLSFESTQLCVASSRHYWKTGLLFTSRTEIDSAVHVNPLFAYSADGEGLRAHCGTHPLTTFHLAPFFANACAASTLSDLYDDIRSQFHQWCTAFAACVRAPSGPKIKIQVYVGDVLATCHALRTFGIGGTSELLPRAGLLAANLATVDRSENIKGSAPLMFDVIDTSNLSDHIGMLNILVSTVPLLKRTPYATIYTETLLPVSSDAISALSHRICADLTTISLLLDLTPTSYLSGYTTASNIHEIISYNAREAGQFYERLAWKIPSQLAPSNCYSLTFETEHLASILFNIYLRMFAYEDVFKRFDDLAIDRGGGRLDAPRYCRRSFAALLACIRPRVSANWSEVCSAVLALITRDKTMFIGSMWYQDLLTHLHLFGLHSEPPYRDGNELLFENKPTGRFRDWTTVPPVVCIAFSVDRSRLRVIEEPGPGRPMHPHLTVQLSGPTWENDFSSADLMFGALTVTRTGADAVATIEEDPHGMHGAAPLVVSVCVPAWIMAHDPRSAVVRLGLANTPSTARRDLIRRLGPRLTLFELPLMDERRIHVLRGRPTLATDGPAGIPYLPVPCLTPNSFPDSATGEESRITHITRGVDIEGSRAMEDLAKADTVVSVMQTEACVVTLLIGTRQYSSLAFSFSVDASRAKVRVARKSAYVEVVLPIVPLGQSGLAVQHRFPNSRRRASLYPWAIHRISVDRLPIVSLHKRGNKELQWINILAAVALSDRERAARESAGGENSSMDGLCHIKDSLHTIFVCAAGLQGPSAPRPTKIFGLNRASRGGMDALFFVADLRLDVASHTVVADAFVLPLTKALNDKLWPALGNITPEILQIQNTDEECIAWKALMPSLVERCRTWSHVADCAYNVQGRVPLSLEHSQAPICACGRGKVTDAFRRRKHWAPFLPHVTRVAISPLFAASYLEPVAGLMKKLMSEAEQTSSASPSGGVASSNEYADSRCSGCRNALPAGKRMVCSRCKKSAYCRKECQTDDWRHHKHVCVRVR
ncbi:DUF4470 and zf-MYND domain-containing protein [Phanerochaete sordida]|uniref:DUF4470 and zf-MYND domain-containing protein n=1 Tax=Phanerochaete sordida TaxID=48140 RepID=A0A9P3FXP9_9APHY|nr:DUF4470 and zf-MYND domain-containing protein [Phanerochaete sordida]